MTKLFYYLSRLIVGLTFIFSGFVKAVDPVGSAIKFGDYLSSFHLSDFSFIVIPLSFIVSALEFLTGIHILLGIRIKTSSIIAMLFMVIFVPLTLGIAIANPVTDCGCFGDAVKLTNWETFAKNIVLLIPTLFLFINRKKFVNTISILNKLTFSFASTAIILSVSFYSYYHLPIIDFRPYKIGNNITEGMIIPEGAAQPEYETSFIMEKDGVQKTFEASNYPYNDSTWIFIDSETKVISKGYEPPIHDFVLTNDEGEDITKVLLEKSTPTLLVISPQINKGTWGANIDSLKSLNKALFQKGFDTFFVTASTSEDITNFEFSTEAGFNYLTADETMLKTMIRSNPGLVLIQDGNVIGKWHYKDIPNAKQFANPTSFALKQLKDKNEKNVIYIIILLSILMSFLILYKKNNSI
ncbi:BT_3928 family protein [Plebeiibacterium sediminum]|uniref:DoxX family protein n=1 Tax=Plebeiibacterium sediminum TaxID=2992112 RepID=A0AAE3SEZ0_9BACT|nr:BT_3928 family protein [Plebeiobacterium sediminum]MCW3786915.1 DoxX family protein [Plebeiobacterium sediminum]